MGHGGRARRLCLFLFPVPARPHPERDGLGRPDRVHQFHSARSRAHGRRHDALGPAWGGCPQGRVVGAPCIDADGGLRRRAAGRRRLCPAEPRLRDGGVRAALARRDALDCGGGGVRDVDVRAHVHLAQHAGRDRSASRRCRCQAGGARAGRALFPLQPDARSSRHTGDGRGGAPLLTARNRRDHGRCQFRFHRAHDPGGGPKR